MNSMYQISRPPLDQFYTHTYSIPGELKDALIAGSFYPDIVPELVGADTRIKVTAGGNGRTTPISDFLVFGHALGDTMFGGASTFRPADFSPRDPSPTFEGTKFGILP